jgi:hypothetical protein
MLTYPARDASCFSSVTIYELYKCHTILGHCVFSYRFPSFFGLSLWESYEMYVGPSCSVFCVSSLAQVFSLLFSLSFIFIYGPKICVQQYIMCFLTESLSVFILVDHGEERILMSYSF